MNRSSDYKKPAIIISLILFVLLSACLLYLFFPRPNAGRGGAYVVEIYQDGRLLERIPLREVRESRFLSVEGPDGCANRIEIRPDSVGVLSADCPDKLCVRQGFIRDDRLPIVCLPNRLIVRLYPEAKLPDQDPALTDVLTY